MNLRINFLVCFIIVSVLGYGQGIRFNEGSWNEIVATATKENKPIFVDAYTDWCGPCKKMAKEVFTQNQVGEYFNKTFFSVSMNMEKGEGVDFAKKYNITAYPTLLFFNSKGEFLNKSVGYRESEELIETSKAALDPKNQLGTIEREYENGDKSLQSLINYCSKLRGMGNYKMATDNAVARLEELKNSEKYTKEAWDLISSYLFDYSSSVFKQFIIDKYKYQKVASLQDINKYIHSVLGNPRILSSMITDSTKGLAPYITVIRSLDQNINSKYYIASAQYFAHLNNANPDTLFKYASNFLDNDYVLNYDDGKMAYYLAFMANRYVDKDGQYLAAAQRWAIKSILLDPKEYKGKFLLAKIWYQQGKYQKALDLAESALEVEKQIKEAGVIKKLFKAETIGPFIEQVQTKLKR